jgi:hypothetical protein
MDDKDIPDFDILGVNMDDLTEEEIEVLQEDDSITAIGLASNVMHSFQPSFVVVGSPHLHLTERGFLYPVEIGLSLNSKSPLTKSGMATILREVADMLDEDINKVMNFVAEATGQDD